MYGMNKVFCLWKALLLCLSARPPDPPPPPPQLPQTPPPLFKPTKFLHSLLNFNGVQLYFLCEDNVPRAFSLTCLNDPTFYSLIGVEKVSMLGNIDTGGSVLGQLKPILVNDKKFVHKISLTRQQFLSLPNSDSLLKLHPMKDRPYKLRPFRIVSQGDSEYKVVFHGDKNETKLIPIVDIQNFVHGHTALAKFMTKKINPTPKPNQTVPKPRPQKDNKDRSFRIVSQGDSEYKVVFHGDKNETTLIPMVDIQNFLHGHTAIAKFIAKQINPSLPKKDNRDRSGRKQVGRKQDRSGREQIRPKRDRSGREQIRPKRDRSGRDRSGREQLRDRPNRFLNMRQVRQSENDLHHTLQAELDNWPLNHENRPLVDPDTKIKILSTFCQNTSNNALKQRACCVCQEGHLEHEMTLVRANEIPNLDLLTTTDNEQRIYLGDRHGDGRVYLCSGCKKTLSTSKPQAPENAIFTTYLGGNQPDCLKGLTLPEMLMISPVICKAYVVKLVSYGDPNSCQRAIKGNSIAFMQDVTSVAKRLPDISAATKYLKVCFIGDKTTALPLQQLRKVLVVRRRKVQEALEFLVENHIGFKEIGITIDKEALRDLPTHDIPSSILGNIDCSDDVDAAMSESSSYIPRSESNVPTQAQEETTHVDVSNPEDSKHDTAIESEPDYSQNTHIPLDRSGVIDVDSTLLSMEDLNEAATDNLDRGDEPDSVFTIPSGSDPVTSYRNPNFWTLAFPTLFCYGLGGCDESKVSMKKWVKHLLLLKDDDRFATHYSFMFVAHSILNVRAVCLQTHLNLTRASSDPIPVTREDLQAAIDQINSGVVPSDPNVARIWRQIRTVGANVTGSNFQRGALSYEIKALMLKLGLPSFFITINPNDIDHPLVMHFAGKQVNLDQPFAHGWLPKQLRAKLVADNPVAVARFFHTLIKIWLSSIMGCGPNKDHDIGVIGRTKAHYGTVETQGRGSLHLHILFWVHGSVTPVDMANKLQEEPFPTDLLNYLDGIIFEQFPNGVVPSQTDSSYDTNKNVSSDRPPLENDPNFRDLLEKQLAALVQKCQVHKHTATCYKYGHEACRFEFPRPAVDISKIEDGVIWLSRRKGNEFVNNYNDIIMLALRCNHDIKFITNGKDGKAVAFYITSYITKNALTTHNAYPLIMAAQKIIEDGVHLCQPRPELSLAKQQNRELVIKCLNKLTTHAERSGPEIATLLIDEKLHYTDHEFSKLYLNPFLWMFKANSPDLEEAFSIQKTGDSYKLVNQKQNYLCRPRVTHFGICLYDFVAEFYKRPIKQDLTMTPASYLFESTHPQHETHYMCRKQAQKAFHVPVLVGPWFPSQAKDPELFAMIFLVLFKPFLSVCDLRPTPTSTWSESLSAWDWDLLEPDHKTQLETYMSNVTAMNTGMEQQKAEREAREKLRKEQGIDLTRPHRSTFDPFDDIFPPTSDDLTSTNTQMLFHLPRPIPNTTLGCFAVAALSQLTLHGGLDSTESKSSDLQANDSPFVQDLNSDPDLSNRLKQDITKQRNRAKTETLGVSKENVAINQMLGGSPNQKADEKTLETIAMAYTLNTMQHKAFMTIGRRLICEIHTSDNDNDDDNVPVSQLLAFIGGPGGTGKSQVIKAIQHLFVHVQKKSWLASAAFTGSAASNISGSTLSSLIKETRKDKKSLTVSINNIAGLKAGIGRIKFMIIDEVSMISSHMLSKLDARLKQAAPADRKDKPFGGCHILFFGDFIQYPCVCGSNLFDKIVSNKPQSNIGDKKEMEPDEDVLAPEDENEQDLDDVNAHSTGRSLWMLLNYSIFFTEQMRQNDSEYLSLLTDLRTNSSVNIEKHAALLAKRTLGHAVADSDATCAHFKHAPIITTRNAVRVAINFQKARASADSQQVKTVVCLARDSLAKKHGDMSFELRTSLLHELDHKTNGMPGMLPLVPGMPLIVKKNLATELGVCNGTRCTFVRMVLHPDEPAFELTSSPIQPKVHFLRKAPVMIVIKMSNPKFNQLDGFEIGEFPIFPETEKFQFKPKSANKSVTRTQFPILPAYAITGYAAQGGTFDQAVVDLTVPTGPACGPTNKSDLYVLLSRVRNLKSLLILRPFQRSVLYARPSQGVFDEIIRLEHLQRFSNHNLPDVDPDAEFDFEDLTTGNQLLDSLLPNGF